MDGWMSFPVDEMKLLALMNTNFSHERFLTYFIFVDKTFSFFFSSHGWTKLLISRLLQILEEICFSLLVDGNEALHLLE